MAVLFIQLMIPCAMQVSAEPDKVVIVTASSVNVRSGAGTGNDRIGTALLGAEYNYLGEGKDSGGSTWYKVQFAQGQTGWISGRYSFTTAHAQDYTQEFTDRIAEYYGAAGIQVAVIENGAVTDCYSTGWATKDTDPMTDDHKIRVASISKAAVAVTAVKMQEQGIVDINADIAACWGANLYRDVTLRSLLTHTSTLKALSYSATREGTLSQLKSSGSYNSGTVGASGSWAYSNFGIGIAGSTLEVAMEKRLDTYAKEYIFAPLGMDAAFSSGLINDTSKLATLYHSDGNVARSVSSASNMTGRPDPGCNTNIFAGGLTCSAQDLAKLTAMLANDGTYNGVQILSPESVALIEQKLFTKTENGGSFWQCMPLRYKVGLYGESELYYHTGNAYGVLALMSYNPATRDGVVVITTGMSDYNTNPACSRDSQGIYEICGKLTEYVYRYHRSAEITEPTTTTTSTATTTTTAETTTTSAAAVTTTTAATSTTAETTASTAGTTVPTSESAAVTTVASASDTTTTAITTTSATTSQTATQSTTVSTTKPTAPGSSENIRTTPMYRLYNPNSGEHFYTGSEVERDTLIEAGWLYEGIAWNAPVNGGEPVYRLYNPNSGDHHYTMSVSEREMLVGYGWQYEGVAWNSASPDNLPLYRMYNPNADCGSHHYTGSTEERDMLVDAGWIYEGIGWFGMLK